MGTIDLNLLPVFAAVAETSSFSAAAKKLGIPKSSVSRGVAALEAAMGLQLLHRTTRHVSLSTAGAALLERITPSLTSLQTSIRELPELEAEPSGRLRITGPIDIGATLLAEIVTRFVKRFPSVHVEICLTNALVDITAERFDLAVRITSKPLRDSSLVARNAGPVGLQLYAAPSYLARKGAPRHPRDLASHDWIVFRESTPQRLTAGNESFSVTPEGRITGDDMFFVRETLRHGAGVGILPRVLADDDVVAGNLVCVLPEWSAPAGQLWIICAATRHLPRKVVAFRDFALEALRGRPVAPLHARAAAPIKSRAR